MEISSAITDVLASRIFISIPASNTLVARGLIVTSLLKYYSVVFKLLNGLWSYH